MTARPATVVFLLAALSGLFFTGWSTSDFVQHLDRQVHAIQCSFIPGLAAADVSGSSGCHVAMMSPYSSVLRTAIWGGIPATLAGMAVFAFLLWRGGTMLLEGQESDPNITKFLALSALLPVLTSLVYGWIAVTELDALCKLCIGIYVSSAVAFGAAVVLARSAEGDGGTFQPVFLSGFGQGVGFVVAPILLYVGLAPDFSKFVGQCGELAKPDDPNGVMVPLGPQTGTPAIEVFDPLCPACKGFEHRLNASGLASQMARKALLFPLDHSCNWMVTTTMHHGACTVSEAVLCAGPKADAVIAWAFEHQEEIRTAAEADPEAAARLVKAAFPDVASCIGSEKAKQKLNRSLRWAVANQLPVLTPQLYVGGRKLCDEDTDLGMDWALAQLLALKESK